MNLFKLLNQSAEHVNTLQLRERILLLLAATATLFLAMDVAALQPALQRQQAVLKSIENLDTNLTALQEQAVVAGQDQRMQLKEQLAVLDSRLQKHNATHGQPPELSDIFDSILEKQTGVSLIAVEYKQIQTGSLSGTGISINPLARYQVDLSFEADESSVFRYLQALESLRGNIVWEHAHLKPGNAGRTLASLRFYVMVSHHV